MFGGNASPYYLNKLFLTQKIAIRAIAGLDFGESTENAFKDLKLLKLDDLFKFQMSNLMWDQDHHILPFSLNKLFNQVSQVHNYGTRSSTSKKLAENAKINTKTHGENMFKYQGPKIFNELKNHNFYTSSKTKTTFQVKHKIFLLSFY